MSYHKVSGFQLLCIDKTNNWQKVRLTIKPHFTQT